MIQKDSNRKIDESDKNVVNILKKEIMIRKEIKKD